jgi:uncharacterized protein (DUF3084 family)
MPPKPPPDVSFTYGYILVIVSMEQLEHASLKEHLQSLLNDNQILKRAVSIQHERNLEHEDRIKGVEQLKHVLSQYQEQVRSLEVTFFELLVLLQHFG